MLIAKSVQIAAHVAKWPVVFLKLVIDAQLVVTAGALIAAAVFDPLEEPPPPDAQLELAPIASAVVSPAASNQFGILTSDLVSLVSIQCELCPAQPQADNGPDTITGVVPGPYSEMLLRRECQIRDKQCLLSAI